MNCEFRVRATGEVGIDTGRPRFEVYCMTCAELIHEATTGPVTRISQHREQV